MSADLPLAPAFLLAAATAMVGRTVWRGRSADGRRAPPDVAFVNHVGYAAHLHPLIGRSSWPLPAVGSADELVQWADNGRMLADEPMAGDLFAIWAPKRRLFAHVGIIVYGERRSALGRSSNVWECRTIEARIGGERARAAVVQWSERLVAPRQGDRIIRWKRVDGYDHVSSTPYDPAEEERVRFAA